MYFALITLLLNQSPLTGPRVPLTSDALAYLPFAVNQEEVGLTVDAKDGDTISGDHNFAVRVQTTQVVNKVEFYVNGELRSSSSSTPYRFVLDTVSEKDGAIELKWIAYTDQSLKGTKTIKVTIDNGMSKGADFHVKAGTVLLQDGKLDEALAEGRIARKIDKNSTAARFLLARAYLQKGVFDQAQSNVEQVIADDPKNLAALDLAGVIGLKQAFNTYARGSNETETLGTIKQAYTSAVEARHKFLDATLDALPAPTDEASSIAYARAAIKAGRFSNATNVLEPLFQKDTRKTLVGNLLAYAYLRNGRTAEVDKTLKSMNDAGTDVPDAYTGALKALVLAEKGDTAGSDAAMSDAVLNDIDNIGVRTAQASIALKLNRTTVLAGLASRLANDKGSLTEVNYLLSAVNNRLHSYANARKAFETALLEEPTNYDMYIEQANRSIDIVLTSKPEKKEADAQYASAELLLQVALIAKGDSYQALTGLAIVSLLEGKNKEGLEFARAAVAARPLYAAGQYALSSALAANRMDSDAAAAAAMAGKIDITLDGAPIPEAAQAWRYFNAGGRSPIIAAP